MSDSAFKSQIAADNIQVFLNELEFADEHDINGTTCKAILQSLTNTTPSTDPTDIVANQLLGDHLVVNCLEEALPAMPTYGNAFLVDGKTYLVESVAADMGLLTITLYVTSR